MVPYLVSWIRILCSLLCHVNKSRYLHKADWVVYITSNEERERQNNVGGKEGDYIPDSACKRPCAYRILGSLGTVGLFGPSSPWAQFRSWDLLVSQPVITANTGDRCERYLASVSGTQAASLELPHGLSYGRSSSLVHHNSELQLCRLVLVHQVRRVEIVELQIALDHQARRVKRIGLVTGLGSRRRRRTD
jgi:hypothetical protein